MRSSYFWGGKGTAFCIDLRSLILDKQCKSPGAVPFGECLTSSCDRSFIQAFYNLGLSLIASSLVHLLDRKQRTTSVRFACFDFYNHFIWLDALHSDDSYLLIGCFHLQLSNCRSWLQLSYVEIDRMEAANSFTRHEVPEIFPAKCFQPSLATPARHFLPILSHPEHCPYLAK